MQSHPVNFSYAVAERNK